MANSDVSLSVYHGPIREGFHGIQKEKPVYTSKNPISWRGVWGGCEVMKILTCRPRLFSNFFLDKVIIMSIVS
jgi:hypothetical protein